MLVFAVPESGFVLKYHRNLNDLVTVVCSVYGIFPAPELSLWINDYRLENGTVYEIPVADGLYDSSVSVQLVLYESLQPDDVIKCMLAVPGTEYRRAKETVFVGACAGVATVWLKTQEFNELISIFHLFFGVPVCVCARRCK